MLPSDSAPVLPLPSVPADAPPLSNLNLFFSLIVSSVPPPPPQKHTHVLAPPSHFLVAVGVQMRLEFLQRTFWAATRQVGVMAPGQEQRTGRPICREEGQLPWGAPLPLGPPPRSLPPLPVPAPGPPLAAWASAPGLPYQRGSLRAAPGGGRTYSVHPK